MNDLGTVAVDLEFFGGVVFFHFKWRCFHLRKRLCLCYLRIAESLHFVRK